MGASRSGAGRLAALILAWLLWPPGEAWAQCACGPGHMPPDPGSGLCLPKAIPGLEQVAYPDSQIAAFRSFRNTTAAGFRDPASGLFMTLFLYDRLAPGSEALAREFQTATDEITSFSAARTLKTSTRLLTLGGQETEAQDRLFLLTNNSTDFVSFMWLAPAGERYLKLRVSYPYRRDDLEATLTHALELGKRAVAAICLSG